LKSIFKRWIAYLNTLFPDENKYFFISTYLPLKIDVSLQIRLGQFPRFWRTQPVSIVTPVQRERKWELGECEASLNSFDKVVRQMIPLHIPTAYLEGYKTLTERVDRLPWPSRPKAIFTSNAYSADDLFKAWAAKNTELEVPLIIGQHGGHFGMSPFSFHEDHQIEVADKWLSWGWSDTSRPKILPVGMLKNFGTVV
jgi:putative transferase (TIGR04331 family)